MKAFARTGECYSKFIANCLDDKTAGNCGNCANCLGFELITSKVSQVYLDKAAAYLESLVIPIPPRKMWVHSSVTKQSKIKFINETGICLSKYGDPGYGELVKRGKYDKSERFSEELIGKSATVLKQLVADNRITHVCCVPSNRSDLVKNFAQRLASRLNLQYVDLLSKSGASKQKQMENSSHQCANAFRSYSVIEGATMPQRVLLVDDIVDSRWTLTVCGHRLMEAGCEKVYPYALADSSQKED